MYELVMVESLFIIVLVIQATQSLFAWPVNELDYLLSLNSLVVNVFAQSDPSTYVELADYSSDVQSSATTFN